jgi:hypothetical protein
MVAAVLSAATIVVWAAQLERLESATPARLIAQMRLAQLAALLLAASSGITAGLVVLSPAGPVVTLDTGLALMLAGLGALVMYREPRQALLLAAAALVAHALLIIAHRPGWLPPGVIPRELAVGSAAYDVVIASLCVWTWRR